MLPGQTRENTVELLTMAIKALNSANSQLNDVAHKNPVQLGAAVKACTAAASQVALAAKGVASTTPGKAAQKKILSTGMSLKNSGDCICNTIACFIVLNCPQLRHLLHKWNNSFGLRELCLLILVTLAPIY